ncbi:SDR family oxidoreductase [Streptomyces sp. TP-A0874]|uniref:SDR family oxidoreductase n=1 Tax=Streptomyces sp. TP-A0874 TaxID=549819 RepID=UPI0008529D10|nr:SDR family oxidoreductase [Streptomyces sp. TP-A0874]
MRTGGKLDGRVVVITGAARGIGALLAGRLAAGGARIALLGLEPAELRRVSESLPTESAHWQVDVTDEQALARVAAEVEEHFGRVDAVVANAGVAAGGRFVDSAASVWNRVVQVNLLGSANTARAFLPMLLESRGYLLQIASLAALTPAPLMSAYCASKSGVETFAHCLRAELGHRGVGVGVAYLSWTDTDMVRGADEDEVMRELRSRLPWPASRTYPAGLAVARIARGVERRSARVHMPWWLRGAQIARGFSPTVMALVGRYEMPRVDRRLAAVGMRTGLIGAGGAADDRAGSEKGD